MMMAFENIYDYLFFRFYKLQEKHSVHQTDYDHATIALLSLIITFNVLSIIILVCYTLGIPKDVFVEMLENNGYFYVLLLPGLVILFNYWQFKRGNRYKQILEKFRDKEITLKNHVLFWGYFIGSFLFFLSCVALQIFL